MEDIVNTLGVETQSNEIVKDKENKDSSESSNVTAKVPNSFEEVIQEKEVKKEDAAIIVKVSADQLSASILIQPPLNGGEPATFDKIMETLKAKKVVFGINVNRIHELADNPIYDEEIIIATGLPPIDGKDAILKFHFDMTKEHKPKINEDGTVDFRNIGIIENISPGQVLCTKTPLVPGRDGKAVTGIVLKAKKALDKPLPLGKNTIASEDNLSVRSIVEGQVDFVNNKINVLDTFEIRGDVGPETGNIEFIGNVVIFGNVPSGYSITSGGNIRIEGIVEAAHIRAEGSITICRGMNGMGKGILESMENINCKYVENSIVVARGTVRAESMLNCKVRCGGNIEVIGKRGMLVGGTYFAGQDIIAKTIGSDAYALTEVEVGKDPTLLEKLNEVNENISKLKKEIDDLNKITSYLNQIRSFGKLSDDKLEVLNNAQNTKEIKRQELEALEAELTGLNEEHSHKSKGKIVYTDRIYPGVKVAIGIARMTINNEFKNGVLYRKEDVVIIGSP